MIDPRVPKPIDWRLAFIEVILMAALASAIHFSCPTAAAQAPVAAQPPLWANPQAMFENLFGKEGEIDEKVLARIEISVKEEQRIGKEMVEAYLANLRRQRIRVTTQGKEVAYLQQLVAKLYPMMDHRERYPTIQIYLALSDHCDAQSFPGGYLVFFRGLLESADNEAALIGIVGHEMAHLDRGHHTRRIKLMKLTRQAFSGGRGGARPMNPQEALATGTVMMRAWGRPFRADYERESDLDGARWSYQAGYDCREMAKLFVRVRDRNGNVELPIPEFFRSHPAVADRHQSILAEYNRLQAEMPNAQLYIGKENLRRRTVHEP